MNKLKPCPFCGSKKIDLRVHDEYYPKLPLMFGVVCFDCQAGSCQFFRNTEEAIKAWNKRVGEGNV